MPEINLLPPELKPKGYAIKLSKTLRKIATLSLILFVAAFSVFIIANLVLSYREKAALAKIESLKSEVLALEKSEQKYVLVKDRLLKASLVNAESDATDEVQIVKTVLEKLPQDVSINKLQLDKNRAKIQIAANDSSGITRFFSMIINSGFKKIDLTTFSYDSEKRYLVEVGISK